MMIVVSVVMKIMLVMDGLFLDWSRYVCEIFFGMWLLVMVVLMLDMIFFSL